MKILIGGSPCTYWSIAQSNYPDIVELGDAFDLRRPEWELGKAFSAQKENRAD